MGNFRYGPRLGGPAAAGSQEDRQDDANSTPEVETGQTEIAYHRTRRPPRFDCKPWLVMEAGSLHVHAGALDDRACFSRARVRDALDVEAELLEVALDRGEPDPLVA